jgi:hypothetical protein
MRIAFLVAAFLLSTLVARGASAQELTEEQMGPWSALEKQVALYLKRDWEKHKEFIHPKSVDWGVFAPAPIHLSEAADKYFQEFEEGSDKAIAHLLVPVSVVVAGDVAIINAYGHVLTKPDGKAVETIYRLHNTWKKEEGKWQLLATYNTKVESAEDNGD